MRRFVLLVAVASSLAALAVFAAPAFAGGPTCQDTGQGLVCAGGTGGPDGAGDVDRREHALVRHALPTMFGAA